MKTRNKEIGDEKVTTTTRLSPALITRVKYFLADKRGESMSTFIGQAIVEKLEREEARK
jgi:predicted transcriptional regulator